MAYEIWRDDSLNLSASFETESDALAAVREEAKRAGTGTIECCFLVRLDRSGRRRTVAQGRELPERALDAAKGSDRIG